MQVLGGLKGDPSVTVWVCESEVEVGLAGCLSRVSSKQQEEPAEPGLWQQHFLEQSADPQLPALNCHWPESDEPSSSSYRVIE